MKYINKLKKYVFAFVCLSLIFACFTYPSATVSGSGGEYYASNPNMRIGLLYGSSAVSSFQTSSDNGFLLGYVNENASDKFTVISYSSCKKIKVARGSNNSAVVTDADSGKVLYEYLDGKNNFAAVAATPSNKSMSKGQTITELSVKNTGLTITPAGNTNLGAFIYRIGSGGVEIINLISLEDYIKSVLPYEISSSWHDEALKAFSIAARSFSVFSMKRHASSGFMLCNSTHCQFYAGTKRSTDRTNAAVDATKDMIMTYDGKVAETMYHDACGGVTENHNDAWGGSLTQPYLQSVKIPYEKYNTPGRTNSVWTNSVSPKELYNYLVGDSPQSSKFSGKLNSEIAKIVITERSPSSNYIKSVSVSDKNGNSVTITTSSIVRSAFSKYANSANMDIYKSSKFKSYVLQSSKSSASKDIESGTTHIITANGVTKSAPGDGVLHVLTASGKYSVSAYATGSDFIFDGRGWGHGVGMSQWGSSDMADLGYKYDEILKTFYTGVAIEKMTGVKK